MSNTRNKGLQGLVIFLSVALWGCGRAETQGSENAVKAGVASSPSVEVKTIPSELAAGDVMWIDFDQGSAFIDFAGVDSNAQFKLVVQSALLTESSQSFALADSSEQFHQHLRDQEHELAVSTPIVSSVSKAIVLQESTSVSVGNVRSFKVLNSLVSTSSYITISATSRCVTDKVAMYVDDRVSLNDASVLTQSDVDKLCAQYTRDVETEINVYGVSPDIDNDGVVIALLTPAINQLGASGGGIVTGFFYAGDLMTGGNGVPSSNGGEIVYLLVPDPQGVYGTPISNGFAMSNLLPAVFPHELQHLISYYQHVMVSGGSSEEDWLNEAMSHFTEDLVGEGQENPSRYNLYLQAPASYSIIAGSSPNLSERGGGYLFLRYLYEQSSDPSGFLRNLIQTHLTGVDNLEAAFGGSSSDFSTVSQFLRRFGVALALTNQNVTSDPKFIFADRVLNNTTGNYEGACLVCDANDNRGTVLTGPTTSTFNGSDSLRVTGTGTRIVDLDSFPEHLDISGDSRSALQGVLIRVR